MKIEDMKASVDSMRVTCASVLGVTAYNENHDEKGQFSSGDGGEGGGGGGAAQQLADKAHSASYTAHEATRHSDSNNPSSANYKKLASLHQQAADAHREAAKNPLEHPLHTKEQASESHVRTAEMHEENASHFSRMASILQKGGKLDFFGNEQK